MTVGHVTDNTSVWIRDVLNSEGNGDEQASGHRYSGNTQSFEKHLVSNQMILLPNRVPSEMILGQAS